MTCRVCGAARVEEVGAAEFYDSFPSVIYDCDKCRCRFTQHDEAVYERLHSEGGSRYGGYRSFAGDCQLLFRRSDLAGLKTRLTSVTKYAFVIHATQHLSKDIRILEFGCARGYLTSYFILTGYNILGVDISDAALAGAREAFGDHFVKPDAHVVVDGAAYDVIYHTGMIGCVLDPKGLTRHLLGLLKPGGLLLFNAPNADRCCLKGQLWLDDAPPPDVVTLFRPGFWERYYSDVADVKEVIEEDAADQSFVVALRNLVGLARRRPVPEPLNGNSGALRNPVSGPMDSQEDY